MIDNLPIDFPRIKPIDMLGKDRKTSGKIVVIEIGLTAFPANFSTKHYDVEVERDKK